MRLTGKSNIFLILFLLAPLLIFFYLASAVGDDQQDDPARESARQELLEIRSRMEDEKRALSAVMRKEGNILEKLRALRAQLSRSQERLARLSREQEIAAQESRELAAGMVELGQRLARKGDAMKRRLRARYRFGRRSVIRVWFEAESIAELSRRRKYLDAIFMADIKRMAEYKELLAEWRGARERLEAKQASLASLEAVLEEQKRALGTERQSLKSLLRSVKEERSAHEAMLSELRSSAARLRGIIGELDRRAGDGDEEGRGSGAGLERLRGALCYPSPGPVLSGFGKKVHPRFQTVTMHNGIEIGASTGTPVRSVFEGVVRFAEWFRGYGNLVIIDHENGYYSVYAHLAVIRAGVGERVSRGEVIGTVGETGSIEGPSLYFELRRHQQPLNPEHWLGGCTL